MFNAPSAAIVAAYCIVTTSKNGAIDLRIKFVCKIVKDSFSSRGLTGLKILIPRLQ